MNHRWRRAVAHFELQVDDEFTAFALGAVYNDRTAHHLDEVFRDCHSKSCALNLADGARACTREWVKQAFLEFLAHSDTVVFNAELESGVADLVRWLLTDAHADAPPCWRKLDRIR